MSYPHHVRIVEVGPRDGLQNEKGLVPVEQKLALIEALAEAGLTTIEAGSFVSPARIPAMAGTKEVMSRLVRRPGVAYPVLVPNLRGLHDAMQSGAREISVFGSASESFSRRNINCSIAESLDRFAPVVAEARAAGLGVRGYISCVLGCPYEGAVAPEAVRDYAARLIELGCDEVSLGDTIGIGTPLQARRVVECVAREVPIGRIALHFHDTYGQALANILACLPLGVSVLDSAVAGLGGCPYARGATGNVATEDLVYMLDGMGIEAGVNLDRVCETGAMISAWLGRGTASRVGRARAARA